MITQATRPQFIFVSLGLICLFSAPAHAVTTNWIDNSGGSFNTASNWDNGVPDDTDIAVFDRGNSITYTVTFARIVGGDITNDRLVVGSNTVTFNPFGTPAANYILDNTTTVEADAILGMPVRGVTIGAEANDTAAVLTSRLSLLQAVAATLGHVAGSSGTLTLDQNNDLFNVTGGSSNVELIIGRLGIGVLNVSAGADVTVNGVAAGFPAGNVSLGRGSSGQGTANISGTGSTLDTNGLFVGGDAGTGTLNVTAGGHVENLTGMLGNLAGSTGTANVSGAGSTWSNALLFVGEFGQGTLNITGGGVVDSQTASLAGQTSSTSTATVSGAGSTWNSTTALRIGTRGNGTLSVTGGGHVGSGESSIGWLAASLGTVNVSGTGSTWTSSNTLYVGDAGTGTLNIIAGGHVTSTAPMFGAAGYIARESGSTGAVTVDGGGSTWTNNGALFVGSKGNGTLDITAGGRVTTGGNFGAVIGDFDDATGVVNVDGAGSTWSSTGLINVAWSGEGTLNITGGGLVESNGGAVGEMAGSIGHATVDGTASTWTNTNLLVVGDFGNGTLDITAGGHVTNTTGYIGGLAGSIGAVLVDGAGSLWTNTGDLFIGNMGQGTLTVQNGGLVDVDGNVNINSSSTATMQFAAIGGNVNNGGQLNLRFDCMDPLPDPIPPMEPPIDIGGDLTNDGAFDLRFDCMDPLPDLVPTIGVGRGITNNGTFTVTNADEQDVTIQLGAGHSFTNNASGVVDLHGPEDVNGDGTIAARHVLGGNVVNQGEMNIRTNAQIAGSLTVAVDADLVIDAATPCCSMTVEIVGPIANSGTLTMTNASALASGAELASGASNHQYINLQAGGGFTNSGTFNMTSTNEEKMFVLLLAGASLVNNASGIVNLDGPDDLDNDGMIETTHMINGDVVNHGRMNIRTNAQIAGSLDVAVDADVVIDSIQPCCNMVLDIGGGVTNSGEVTLKVDAIEPCCNLAVLLGSGETFTNNASGVLQGTGTIVGNVLNRGEVRPGNSTGVLTVLGDYTQQNDGTLVVEIGGTTPGSQHDQLAIDGQIALGGLVEVVFAEGFSPQPGNRFDVVTTAVGVSGQFVGAELPGLPAGMDWNILYGTNIVSLVTTIPGDYNSDGSVDAADFVAWRKTLGQAAVRGLGADGDPNGTIDEADYTVWRANFGATAAGAAAVAASGATGSASANTAVPEPSTIFLASIVIIALLSTRRHPERRR